jgi:predicted nucleotidyltransferase
VTLLLSGIVGSTAYGLDRPGSDVDRLGVFAASTIELCGLDWTPRRDTVVTTKPDSTLHEVGKYLRLALKANPSLVELLWLPEELLETGHPLGARLVDLRGAFLSESGVRSSYGAYARQQAQRLANRGDGSFSADTRKRTAKHARHLARLLRQGRELLSTGELTVRVPDPEWYWQFDDMTPAGMLAVYEKEDALFTATASVLPAEPDRDAVRAFLADVRRACL